MGNRVYRAVVVSNTLGKSKNNGTPSVRIQVQTTMNVTTGEPVSKTLTGDIWLTANAVKRSRETLYKVFGWNQQSFATLHGPILKGIETDIVVSDEVWEDATYEKIDFFNRPGEGQGKPLDVLNQMEAQSLLMQLDSQSTALQNAPVGFAPPQPSRTAPPANNLPPQGHQGQGTVMHDPVLGQGHNQQPIQQNPTDWPPTDDPGGAF